MARYPVGSPEPTSDPIRVFLCELSGASRGLRYSEATVDDEGGAGGVAGVGG